MNKILILTAMKEELKDVAGLPATPSLSLAPFAVPGLEYMASGDLHLSVSAEKRKSIRIKASSSWNQKIDGLLKNGPYKIHHGTVLSGSEFVGGTVRKDLLKRTFADALLVDMEACSVAYLCEKAQVPFVIAKTVADTTHSKPTDEYVSFLTSSQKKTADIIDGL